MSMLAEVKRKQKWTSNPQGKQWSNDSNKIGQKMLEKMGWSNGKGLGASEQGITQHIRIDFKNDQTGFGFSQNHHDHSSTAEHDSFSTLLQNLQAEVPTSKLNKKPYSQRKSLEQKSKHSQVRVHYQKSTRGKDVHKYTPKDLANIFGKKKWDARENINICNDIITNTKKSDTRNNEKPC